MAEQMSWGAFLDGVKEGRIQLAQHVVRKLASVDTPEELVKVSEKVVGDMMRVVNAYGEVDENFYFLERSKARETIQRTLRSVDPHGIISEALVEVLFKEEKDEANDPS